MIMDAAQLNGFLAREFPQVSGQYRVEQVDQEGLTARLLVDHAHLRPGGTVSGPAMFALADLAIYCVILSRIGPVALAVTTSASIDFMRKPRAGCDIVARCRLLKLGRSLAVAEAHLESAGSDNLVARCSMTYAIPSK